MLGGLKQSKNIHFKKEVCMATLNLADVYMYSFLAYAYDSGKLSPSDILTPLVLKSVVGLGKTNFSIADIQAAIKTEFAKNLPLIIIENEITKLVKRGLIKRNDNKEIRERTFSIDSDLSSYQSEYEESSKITDYFLSCFKEFLIEKDNSFSEVKYAGLVKRIESFCLDNVVTIVKYFRGESPTIRRQQSTHDFDLYIEEFFLTRVIVDDRLIKGFEAYFNGINLMYIYENCAKAVVQTDYEFGEKIFYLDTNILLRILALQNEYYNKLGKELYDILIENGFTLRVHKITIDELFSLLRGYRKAQNFFISGKNVNHVYQVLKDRKVLPHEIDEVVEECRARMKELGIEIDNKTEWHPLDYVEFETKIELLAKKKYELRSEDDSDFDPNSFSASKYIYQAKHDMRAIEIIRTIRGECSCTAFEDTPSYFITAEGLLLRFNYNEYRTTKQCETISDGVIAFLAYFHNPANVKGIALQSFVVAHFNSRDLTISNWMKYVGYIYSKYKAGKIDNKKLGYLLTKTIIDNDRIRTIGIEEIANEGMNEYDRMVEQLRKKEIESEAIKIASDKKAEEAAEKLANEIGQNVELLAEIHELSTETKKHTKDIQDLRTQMKSIRVLLYSIFGFFILFSLLLITQNTILGSTGLAISTILEILTYIDSKLKYIIKD